MNAEEAAKLIQAGARGAIARAEEVVKTLCEIDNGDKLNVTVSWNLLVGKDCDLDLSAMAYDGIGTLLDACYFNQRKACDTALIHSGDQVGDKEGVGESIYVSTSQLPSDVEHVVFLITCTTGTFADVESSICTLTGGPDNSLLCEFGMGSHGTSTAFVTGALSREGRGWMLKELSGAGEGRNFMEAKTLLRRQMERIVEPDLLAEGASRPTTRSFNLKKDEVYTVDPSVQQVKMGLGWDSVNDLDGGCLVYNHKFEHVATVDYQKLMSPGIHHSGDNTTGFGSGDDEVITVTFGQLPPSASYLFFGVCIFDENTKFSKVDGEYTRMVQGKQELCRYDMDSPENTAAVRDARSVITTVLQRVSGTWRMRAILIPGQSRIIGEMQSECYNWLKQHCVYRESLPPLATVTVTVTQGRGLPAMDRSGTSDPYVVLSLTAPYFTPVTHKSSTEKKNLDPLFSRPASATLQTMFPDATNVEITVYDWNRFSSNTPMGTISFQVGDLLCGEHKLKVWKELTSDHRGPGEVEVEVVVS